MDNIYIKLIPNHPKLDQVMHEIMDEKISKGDNTPLFVAPKNPKSPEGKTWTIGTKIGNDWYNQSGFGDTRDEETHDGGLEIKFTGGINVLLKPQDSSPKRQTNQAPQRSGYSQNKYFARAGGYGRR